MPLTPKQQSFVDEYLIDLNATQAAIRAGYSAKTAQEQSSRLLSNVMIQGAVAEAKAARAERVEVQQDDVLRELMRLGFSDLRKVFSSTGSLLPPEEWPDDVAASISSVEVVSRPTSEKDEDGNVVVEHVHKIKVWDKNTALTNLGKHLPTFFSPEKRELSGNVGGGNITVNITPVAPVEHEDL